ncbi:hypothetical protein SJI00_05120 [Pseudomonas sp. RP23018S]|uniref:hypothetical protein n=1 Tax=Pseudomonas sp. RP23018S TaxID=3096037 RepID=UPI002ACA1CEB|nr:hypothetical protein [Pseudomonas sp. RP23018S]MDZ5602157.1 hypothetical protein [Pseudomonas sp. RP23018S]
MKRLPHLQPTPIVAIKRALLTLPLLTCVAAHAASTSEATQADITPIISMYQGELACSKELPATGGLVPVQWRPKQVCPKGGEDEDEPFEAHSIRIRNMPIKSTVLLIDSNTCVKDGNAWIELDTSRANASLERMGVDKLWTYAGSAEKPGYVYNKGDDSNAPSYGFRIIGKGNAIKPGELACVVISTPKRGH